MPIPNWDNIHSHSKIFLPKKTDFHTFDEKIITLESGFYYISGFWANVVGLSTTLEKAHNGQSDFHIASMNLKVFQREKRV